MKRYFAVCAMLTFAGSITGHFSAAGSGVEFFASGLAIVVLFLSGLFKLLSLIETPTCGQEPSDGCFFGSLTGLAPMFILNYALSLS